MEHCQMHIDIRRSGARDGPLLATVSYCAHVVFRLFGFIFRQQGNVVIYMASLHTLPGPFGLINAGLGGSNTLVVLVIHLYQLEIHVNTFVHGILRTFCSGMALAFRFL
ncbi:hypothetical protein DFS34DRAFT_608670, partial [Phlyctochytrium arcticum]